MLKTLFRYFYPKAPAPIPPATADQVEVLKAVICALSTHVQRHGDIILAVRVPGYTGATPDLRFSVSGIADFAVEVGVDPYGDNVVIEANPYRITPKVPNTVAVALNEMVAATAKSASTAVTAETITDSAVKVG